MKRFIYFLFLLVVIWFGFTLGQSTGGDLVVDAERDIRTDFPLPPPPPDDTDVPVDTSDRDDERMVVVEMPVRGAMIEGTLRVSGRAHPSLKKILVTVKSSTGELLFDEYVAVKGGTGNVYGRFESSIDMSGFPLGDLDIIFLGITKEGIEEKDVRTVTLTEPDSITVVVFFANSGLGTGEDAGVGDICISVHPVERQVSSRTHVYRTALEELTVGPSPDEKKEGYTTSLPSGVILRFVAADAEGVVTADFTSSLERGVAGSCRIQAIREQIEMTLEQFPEVRSVVITVNGEGNGVLQP